MFFATYQVNTTQMSFFYLQKILFNVLERLRITGNVLKLLKALKAYLLPPRGSARRYQL